MSDNILPPTVSIAFVNTGRFDFMAVAADSDAARDAVMQAWWAHVEQYDADPNWLRPDEINIVTGPLGQAWRDGSPFPRKD